MTVHRDPDSPDSPDSPAADDAPPPGYRGDGPLDAAATTAAQSALTAADLIAFVSAAAADGLVRHNIEGYDALISGGLNDIITKQFDLTRAWKSERPPTTEEDRSNVTFEVRLSFHDLHVGTPTCTTYATGLAEPMYPARARLTGQPYAGPVTVAATVAVRAFKRDGNVAETTAEIPPFPVGSFPVMVRGANCHTRRCTGAALAQLGEDPTDPGGYFVAKMGEWVVDLLENIRYNTIHVHARMGGTTELVRAEFLSQPGGAFDNSSSLRLRLMQSGTLTFELNSTHFEKARLPFFLLFRLFGMTSDRDIAATVVYRPEAPATPADASMCEILAAAFHLADASYEWALNELAPATLAARTAEQMITYLQGSAFASDDNAAAYVNDRLLATLDKVILPHVGVTPADRPRKLRFLGLMIRRALLVHLGARDPTDRDSYKNKRVHGAGVSLAKAFKTQVTNSVVGPLVKALKRELRNNPFSALTPGAIVGLCRNALVASDLNRAMEQAITSGGGKASVVKRKVVPSRVSSQMLERKNALNVLCALRAIVTQHAGASPKGTDRADQMRRVHPTYAGFICPLHSLDTGENVGMKKQLASTTGVTPAGDAPALKRRLLADPMLMPLAALSDADLASPGRARVFVNGDWLGATDDPAGLAAKYRRARRRGAVDPLTSVCWDPAANEVEFWLDVGRLYRPLLIVDGNGTQRDAALRASFASPRGQRGQHPVPEFFQGCRLTAEDARGLAAGRVSIADLVEWGIAEYVTPEEQESCLVAPNFDALRAAARDPARRYTHVEVEQALLGVAALVSPYLDRTQPVRVTYETNQARQTGGWYALNFFARVDKNRFFQYYCEQPLVYTVAHAWYPSNGFNVSIAYMCYGGDNQEDSVIVNRAAADRGLFAGAFFHYEKAELEKGEVFATPDPATTKGLKPNSRYEKLVDGFVRPGTVVEYGDVLVGRVARLPRGRDDRFTHADRSIVYRKHEPAVVEEVMRPRGVNDEVFGLVKLRYERPLVVGDKVSSRSGNKSITARLVSQSDMPFDETGATPDLIINPHSFPKRMVMGQLIETVVGVLCARRGAAANGTAFLPIDYDQLEVDLVAQGLRPNGRSRLYHGATGAHLDVAITLGFILQQRLQKFVLDEEQCVGGAAPTDATTGQPLGGKHVQGGLRLGYMEIDTLVAQGAAFTAEEKLRTDSDARTMYVCRSCGGSAVVNDAAGVFDCRACGEAADVVAVPSTKSAMLFREELAGGNIDMRLGPRPREFERMCPADAPTDA